MNNLAMKVYDLMKMAGSFIELIGNYSSLFSNQHRRIWACPDDCSTQSVWKTHISVEIAILPTIIFISSVELYSMFTTHAYAIICSFIYQHFGKLHFSLQWDITT